MSDDPVPHNMTSKLLTLSELRRELGIPLVLAKKLVIWGEIEAVRAIDGTLRVTTGELDKAKRLVANPWKRSALFVRALGPGLITGASDDDPSGIATYSSVGAKFGFSMIWTAAWLLPIMLAVQESCARIGIVTNKGLAGVLSRHYRKRVVFTLVTLLVVANIINIGADLGAMGASVAMLTDFDPYVGAVFFAVIIVLMEVFVQYHSYVRILKWLTLSVFAYIIAGISVRPDWLAVAKTMFVPHMVFSREYIIAIIAVFGTTVTPYLFFWQASEEVEEAKLLPLKKKSKKLIHGRIARMRTDVNTGMFLANVVFFFIVLTTAQVLFSNGITEIDTAEKAAQALRPFAGEWAYFLFAAGIIGTGLLAIPILAGSSAYALAEVMRWREGLELKYSQARGFYAVIACSILVGLLLNLLQVNPIKALYYSAFINGIIAIPLLVVIMLIGNNSEIMGRETHPKWVMLFGWSAVVFMAIAVAISLGFIFV